LLSAAALALSAAVTTLPAAAQLSQSGGPVAYSADNLEYFDQQRMLVLIGNVEVAQDKSTLRASKLTLYFTASATPMTQNAGFGAGDIERIVAEGDVYFVRPEQTARGDQAIYEVKTDSVTFTGNVVLANDQGVIRGERALLEIGGRRSTISPGQGSGQRVRGVFNQNPSAGR
jgi:lipopolysaccharide export system protein LptA